MLKDSLTMLGLKEIWTEMSMVSGPVRPTEVVVHATPLKDIKRLTSGNFHKRQAVA